MRVKLGRNKITCFLSLIILLVYNVLYYIIPFNRELSSSAFWITYGITNFVILFNLFVVYIGINDNDLRSRVFGIPIIKLGILFSFIQLIFSIIVMVLGSWVKIPYWIVVAVEVILLAFISISLITQKAYKNLLIDIDGKESDELFIKNMRIDLDAILHSSISDDEVKNNLRKLYETAKYTTPISKDCVYELEEEISNKIVVLKDIVQKNNYMDANRIIFDITNLLRERKARLSV